MEFDVRAIFEGLNDEQRAAVEQMQGPVLIVAGAGSGKTRVITCRIANMLAGGVDASRIMALTFTKKAAGEMKERVASMVGPRAARSLVMGTFHSVFIRFLRDYAEFLGYPRDFTIADTSDSQTLLKTCIKELGLSDSAYKPKAVLSRISDAKNNLFSPAAYAANRPALENDTRSKMPLLYQVYDLYWKKCRAMGVMDFDDILFEMNILLKDNPQALENIAGRFDYIMVDEYQDTNRSQYLILKRLASFHRNICVVGDDSQSIYAFRGARIENILNFEKDYPNCRIFRLERNYRSTRTIVDAANSLISHNESRIRKNCYSEAEQGRLIRLVKGYTEREEAYLVVGEIQRLLLREHVSYSDIAILYRVNSQSNVLEDALRKKNIPYMIYSGHSFFERQEIKDMMAYMKLAVNPSDDESFRRCVNKPARGRGATSLDALVAAARAKGLSLMQAALAEGLEEFGLKAAATKKIQDFCQMMNEFHDDLESKDAYAIVTDIAERSGTIRAYREDNSMEAQSRLANVEELCNSVKAFVEQRENDLLEDMMLASEDEVDMDALRAHLPVVTLPQYLEDVALLSAVDVDEDADDGNKVALMTVHSSKGLEFPYVFIVGMEENLFPGGGAMATPKDIEEERRLFYVALTRAGKEVVLSFAQSRMRNGETHSNPVSRFVREIDKCYVENPLDDMPMINSEAEFWGRASGNRPSGGSSPFGRQNSDRGVNRPSGGFSGQRGSSGGYGSGSSSSGQRGSSDYGSGQRGSDSGRLAPVRSISGSRTAVAPGSPSENFVPSPISELRVGQRIEHNRFGPGIILLLEPMSDDIKIKIQFDNFGEKVLLLKYAKIRIIEEKS